MAAWDFGALGMGGDPYGMMANAGMGMLANSQYGPMTALGKGWGTAQQNQLEQAKAAMMNQEFQMKRKQQLQQQQTAQSILDSLMKGGGGGGAGAAPPSVDTSAATSGMGQFPNTASALNIPMQAPQTASQAGPTNIMPGQAQAGQMGMPNAGGGGGAQLFGMEISPQQIGAYKMYVAAGDYEKAFSALAGGDPNATDVLKNYHAYRQQGGKLGLLEYQQALRQQQNINVNNLPENAFATAGAKTQAERYGKIADEGAAATELRGQYGFLKEYAAQLAAGGNETGILTSLSQKFGPYAEALGHEIPGLGTMQAYRALVNKMAPGLRKTGSGNTSDRDIMLFLDSLPSLANRPEANQMVSNQLDAVAQWQEKRGQIAEEALSNGDFKGAHEKIKALGDPWSIWKNSPEYKEAQKGGFKAGVQGAGSTTPNATNAPQIDSAPTAQRGKDGKWKLIQPQTSTAPQQDNGGWLQSMPNVNYFLKGQ